MAFEKVPLPLINDSSLKCQSGDMRLDNGKEGLFDFKRSFDQALFQVGLKRPLMGGEDWEMKENLGIEDECGDMLALSNMPLTNLLHFPGMSSRGILTRFIYYNYVVLSRKTDHYYPSKEYMREKVLSGERLHHAVQKTLCSTEHLFKDEENRDQYLERKLQQKAALIFNDMVATVSSKALKFCGWLFLTLLRQLTSSVHLHEGQLTVLRALSERSAPILYLPLHFSHFDYILLSLVMYHNEIRSPFVASGNNLVVPPFSSIMRRVGGFFIRRKIDNGKDKDLIYRAILQSYMTELLKENQSLEIFIEGTRTRSGLPNQPKTGLLSVAVEALERGCVDDIILVPLCVSYEKLIEGNFDSELMGQPKAPEAFLSSLWTIFKMLNGFYGHIRVNFGPPKSLKKTLYELRTSPACNYQSEKNTELSRSRSLYEQVMGVEEPSVKTALTKRKSSSSPMIETEISYNHHLNMRQHHKMASPPSHFSSPLLESSKPKEDSALRELVALLAEHSIYNGLKSKALMSTNLVAFLLLHRWRCGVSMPVLVRSFHCLISELITRKSDIGFSGDYHEVVLNAINLLGDRLVSLDCTVTGKSQSRSSSVMSVRSRHSASDSGYDLDEMMAIPSDEKLNTITDISYESGQTLNDRYCQNLSDSGEDMSIEAGDKSDVKDSLSTGMYMSMTDSETSVDEVLLASTHIKPLSSTKEFSRPPPRESRNDVCLYVRPVLEIPRVFELAYYANALTPIFALESVVALAIGATTAFRFSTLEKQLNIIGNEENESLRFSVDQENVQTSFLRSSLLDKSLELIDILQMDLILCDVTKNLESAVADAIDSLIENDVVTSEEYGVTAATLHSEAARDLCFDEEVTQDQWLKVNLTSAPQLISKMSIMSSFVECYVIASSQLTCLLNNPLSESQFKAKILSFLQDRANTGVSVRAESSSSEMVKYAVRSFLWNGIIVQCGKDGKSFALSPDFADAESIANLVSRISQFLL